MDIDTQREFLTLTYSKTLAILLSAVIKVVTDDTSRASYLKYFKRGPLDEKARFNATIAFEMRKINLSHELILQFSRRSKGQPF